MRSATRLLALLAGLLSAHCGGAGGAGSASGVPRPLRDRAATQEVMPYDGFAVPGLRLYRVSGHVSDDGWSYVVGLDATDHVIEREALMRRLGSLEPDVLASRALGVLLGELRASPLLPSDPRPQFASEAEWSLVAPPRLDADELVFFLMVGEMSPDLTEIRIDTTTFRTTQRSATDVLLAAGRSVPFGPPMCAPIATCGCWTGCQRFEPLRVPNDQRPHYRAVDGPHADRHYVPGAACTGEACARTCRVDAPGAYCDPALEPLDPEECTESCPPREAPFHCDTLVDACQRVEHPIRAARP